MMNLNLENIDLRMLRNQIVEKIRDMTIIINQLETNKEQNQELKDGLLQAMYNIDLILWIGDREIIDIDLSKLPESKRISTSYKILTKRKK